MNAGKASETIRAPKVDEGKDHLVSGTLSQVVVHQCANLLVRMKISTKMGMMEGEDAPNEGENLGEEGLGEEWEYEDSSWETVHQEYEGDRQG